MNQIQSWNHLPKDMFVSNDIYFEILNHISETEKEPLMLVCHAWRLHILRNLDKTSNLLQLIANKAILSIKYSDNPMLLHQMDGIKDAANLRVFISKYDGSYDDLITLVIAYYIKKQNIPLIPKMKIWYDYFITYSFLDHAKIAFDPIVNLCRHHPKQFIRNFWGYNLNFFPTYYYSSNGYRDIHRYILEILITTLFRRKEHREIKYLLNSKESVIIRICKKTIRFQYLEECFRIFMQREPAFFLLRPAIMKGRINMTKQIIESAMKYIYDARYQLRYLLQKLDKYLPLEFPNKQKIIEYLFKKIDKVPLKFSRRLIRNRINEYL